MSERDRIQVIVVTGFLGSGKTTFLNRLLGQDDMAGTLAVVNEFGEVGLDHLLLEVADERLALLDNGCVCCTVRDDLISTLIDVDQRRKAGDLTVNRVVLETTGLADPAPILHAFMAHPELEATYAIGAVLTVVDAVVGPATLNRHAEARKQLAVADIALVSKTDMASPTEIAVTLDKVGQINGVCDLVDLAHADLRLDNLLAKGFAGADRNPDAYRAWIEAVEAKFGATPTTSTRSDHHDHEHDHGGECLSGHHDISTYAFTFEQPIDWALFREWLDYLAAIKGADLLRFKGLVHIAQDPTRPVVVHGVQHIFHRPHQLDAWPSDDHRTRLVFIVRGIPREVIERTLTRFVVRGPWQTSNTRESRATNPFSMSANKREKPHYEYPNETLRGR